MRALPTATPLKRQPKKSTLRTRLSRAPSVIGPKSVNRKLEPEEIDPPLYLVRFAGAPGALRQPDTVGPPRTAPEGGSGGGIVGAGGRPWTVTFACTEWLVPSDHTAVAVATLSPLSIHRVRSNGVIWPAGSIS